MKIFNFTIRTIVTTSLFAVLCPSVGLADEPTSDTTTQPQVNSRSQVLKEPAYVTPTRLGPMPDAGSHRITEIQIGSEAKPVFERRLTMLLEQINLAESKGWITADQASGFRTEHSGIVTLSNTIKDPTNIDRKTVDDVEGKITALNAALYAASNKKSPDTQASPSKSDTSDSASPEQSAPEKSTKD
jgi:hypothetical protein